MALNDLKLTFRDEFNSLSLDTGTKATDANLWNSSMHNGYVRSLSGNKEEQIYMDRDYKGLGVNPFSIDNGILSIKAAPSSAAVKSATGYKYTSGALTTQGEFSQKYGYFEIRAQVPEGKGLWPAFWLLNDNEDWPPELDVMEMIGSEPTKLHQTVHTDWPDTAKVTYLKEKMTGGFHTYGMDWTKDKITFYYDGKATGTVATPPDVHDSMYLVLNMAVGGTWPGSPNSSTNWANAQYKVDYVRVYQHTGVAGSGGVLGVNSGVVTTPANPTPTTPAPSNPTPNPTTPAALSGLVLSHGTSVTGSSGRKFVAADSGANSSKSYSAAQLGIGASGKGVTVSFDGEKDLKAVHNGAWNSVKNASYVSSSAKEVTLENFVAVNVGLTGNRGSTVSVKDAKRGSIITGGGNDKIAVSGISNAWSDNTLTIDSGAGNDVVSYSGESDNRVALKGGAGNDSLTLSGKASGNVDGGAGDDRIAMRSRNVADVKLTGGSGRDVFSFIAGAHATITDFKAGEDRVELSGVSSANVKVRHNGVSTMIDLNGKNAVTLSGVTLNASQLNLSYV
ncbi:MAG TPA: family 16 glycosylhydrolase [Alphaproteobacteria bacterium]|nr:family 16 glycosylhydrolase [Alphaproteobacteria bacterium]